MVGKAAWVSVFTSVLVGGVMIPGAVGWVLVAGGMVGGILALTPARGWGIYRVDGSWRLLSKPPGFVVRWQKVGDQPRPEHPISTLWIEGLELVNPTSIPVVVDVVGHWSVGKTDILAEESNKNGQVRVEAHDSRRTETMIFEIPTKEVHQHDLSFVSIHESRRYVRVTDHLSGKVLQQIEVDDGAAGRQMRLRFLQTTKQSRLSLEREDKGPPR